MSAEYAGTGLLDGVTAIVTGAAQGIGLAIVEAFVRESARVVAVDLDQAKVERATAQFVRDRGDVVALRCDVTDGDEVRGVVAQALERFGALNALVNNAGVTKDGYISRLSEDDFDLVMDVSVKGAWLATQAVSTHFRSQAGGSIVNLSSISGKVGNPGQTNYSAAKAAVVGLTKAAAKELGPSGVRVNAVQPGLVRTAMTLAMKPEVFAAKEAEVPLGRAGTVEEVANAVVFLCSPLASYINGAVLEVSGGRGI